MSVRLERVGAAAVVTLAWPERRNAIGPAEAAELAEVLAIAGAEPAIHGVILTGDGAFCAGGDLKGAASRVDMPEAERRRLVYGAFQGLIRTLLAIPVPTVAAVDGAAVGLGFDLALACDSRFIGPEGWCMQGWGRVGFVPGTGGELLLRRLAPDLVWRLLEEQPRIDAAMAERWRLAEPAEPDTARQRALRRVDAFGKLPRPALQAYVALHRAALRDAMEPHLVQALDHQLALLADPAVKARIAAVLKG